MENIKAMFFAQYWGQEVNHYRISKLSPRKIEKVNGSTFGYLKLKPISQITNQDALSATELLGNSNHLSEESRIHQFKQLFESPKFWVNQINIPLGKSLLIFDFLRSKGYALPFMEYSVEQLIELGWVKLEAVKKQLQDLEKGDSVWCGGDSGFSRYGIVKITKVSFQFDEKTGEKYKVIHLGSSKYDSRDGSPLNPPLAYYIKAI